MDRNTFWEVLNLDRWLSLSARRAWIEIKYPLGPQAIYPVALRKESVDRNARCRFWVLSNAQVALRKESVDRNLSYKYSIPYVYVSLSARRAWIEMIMETPWLWRI